MLASRSGILFITTAYFVFLTFFAGEMGLIDSGGVSLTPPGQTDPVSGGSAEPITIFGVEIPGTAEFVSFMTTVLGFFTWAGDVMGVFWQVFTLNLDVPAWFALFFVTLPMFLMVSVLLTYLFQLLDSLPIPFS